MDHHNDFHYEPYDYAAEGELVPSMIPESQFEKFYSEQRDLHPYLSSCLGKRNPYTGQEIDSENDYYEYLREYCYHKLVDSEFYKQSAALMVSSSSKSRELSTLRSRLSDLSARADEAEIREQEAINRERTASQELREAKSKYRTVWKLFLTLFAVLLVASFVVCSQIRSRSFQSGAASKDSEIAERESAAASEAYDQGYSSGYAEGCNEGWNQGYESALEQADRQLVISDDLTFEEWLEQKGNPSAESRSDEWALMKEYNDYLSGTSGSGSFPSYNSTPIAQTYIGNRNSHKFHLPTCSSLPAQKNQVIFNSREEAIAAGYVPCQRCNP